MRFYVTVGAAEAMHVVAETVADTPMPERPQWTWPDRLAQALADSLDNDLDRRVWTVLELANNRHGARALDAFKSNDDSGWERYELAHLRAEIAAIDTAEAEFMARTRLALV